MKITPWVEKWGQIVLLGAIRCCVTPLIKDVLTVLILLAT